MSLDSLSDDELLRSVASERHHEAFSEVFKRHERAAFSVAWHLTHDRDAAEEAVQEGMLRAWKYAGSYRSSENPRGWLLRIVARESFRLIKRKRKRQERMDTNAESQAELVPAPPGEDVDRTEVIRNLWDCLEKLPSVDRQMVALSYGAGYSQAEIGKEMGMSQRSVSYRLRNALERLRQGLTQAGVAAAPAVVPELLGEAVRTSVQVPSGMIERGMANILKAGSLKTAAAPLPGHVLGLGRAGWSVVAVAVLAVGGMGAWLYVSPSTGEPDSTRNKMAGGGGSTTDREAALRRWAWTSDTRPSDEFVVVYGSWDWRTVKGSKQRFLVSGGTGNGAAIVLPVRDLRYPVRLSLSFRTLGPGEYRISCGRTDGKRSESVDKWPSATLDRTPGRPTEMVVYFLDRFSVTSVRGKAYGVARCAESPPKRQLFVSGLDIALERIEVVELAPEKLPDFTRDPERLIAGRKPATSLKGFTFSQSVPFSQQDRDAHSPTRQTPGGR